MARGREQHQERLAAVAALGRSLSRRAGHACELCGESGSLKVVEVEPVLEEADGERAFMACGRCEDLLGGGRLDARTLRFLETAIWNEVLPVQLTAVRLARKLAGDGTDWASDALDSLYLDEAVETLL